MKLSVAASAPKPIGKGSPVAQADDRGRDANPDIDAGDGQQVAGERLFRLVDDAQGGQTRVPARKGHHQPAPEVGPPRNEQEEHDQEIEEAGQRHGNVADGRRRPVEAGHLRFCVVRVDSEGTLDPVDEVEHPAERAQFLSDLRKLSAEFRDGRGDQQGDDPDDQRRAQDDERRRKNARNFIVFEPLRDRRHHDADHEGRHDGDEQFAREIEERARRDDGKGELREGGGEPLPVDRTRVLVNHDGWNWPHPPLAQRLPPFSNPDPDAMNAEGGHIVPWVPNPGAATQKRPPWRSGLSRGPS